MTPNQHDDRDHLRAVISHAIDLLDGEEDEVSATVLGSELISKLTEHLDAYHLCYALCCQVAGMARKHGTDDVLAWLDGLVAAQASQAAEIERLRAIVVGMAERVVKQSDQLSRNAERAT